MGHGANMCSGLSRWTVYGRGPQARCRYRHCRTCCRCCSCHWRRCVSRTTVVYLHEVNQGRWWHDWKNDQFDELAAALVAGHLIECSTYVTGGYYSMFKDLMKKGKHLD